MNTENTAESILRYLKVILISGDARTQKNLHRLSQKESLQRRSLDIIFFYTYHKSINIILIFLEREMIFQLLNQIRLRI